MKYASERKTPSWLYRVFVATLSPRKEHRTLPRGSCRFALRVDEECDRHVHDASHAFESFSDET